MDLRVVIIQPKNYTNVRTTGHISGRTAAYFLKTFGIERSVHSQVTEPPHKISSGITGVSTILSSSNSICFPIP